MHQGQKISAALLKTAKFDWSKIGDYAKAAWDYFNNGLDPRRRDALIGTVGGGLLAGSVSKATGGSFMAPALGGALAGGVGGYFREPIWNAVRPMLAGPPKKGDALKDSFGAKVTSTT